MATSSRSINEGGDIFAVTTTEEQRDQYRADQQAKANDDRQRVRADGMTVDDSPSLTTTSTDTQVGAPGFESGGPNDPAQGGTGYQGGYDPEAQSGMVGDPDDDGDIENESAYFSTQASAVESLYGSYAERRDPQGNRRAAKDAPMASDGNNLPGQSEMSIPGAEPLVNADQMDAAREAISNPAEAASSVRERVPSSLSEVKTVASENPLMVGGAALALVMLFII